MTEQEYIEAKALGSITAAINVLRDLVPANLKEVIRDDEGRQVFHTLSLWQERLFEIINTESNEPFFNCA